MKDCIPLFKAGVTAAVDTQAHKPLLFQEGKAGLNGAYTGIGMSTEIMIAARQIAKIKGNTVYGSFFGI